MKKITLAVILILIFFSTASGQKLTFSYDASGNQTLLEYCPKDKCSKKSVLLQAQVDSLAQSIAAVENELEVQDEKDAYSLTLTPNPTTGWVGIQISGPVANQIQSIQVFDFNGRLLIEKSGKMQQLDLAQLPPALYLARFVMHDGNIITKKIIKK